jgi:hypothetical protein
MENKATTKTPIPARPGFRNFALCTLIFAFSIRRRSTLVETPLQIGLFFCKTNPILLRAETMQLALPQGFMQTNGPRPTRKNKANQTQFVQSQNDSKPLPRKALCKSLPPPTRGKTNPIKPNSPSPNHQLSIINHQS